VRVDPGLISVDDGDTVSIRWPNSVVEIVRILGIDTPETRHIEHDIPLDQPFGAEARAFAQGAFAAATEVELLRAAMLDPYDRSLAYLFLNGRNYSLLAITAGYSGETVSFYGDNGLPKEAATLTAAAQAAAPLAFEPPHLFRARMRALASWLKQNGQYPTH
jgi:endonuclease YncB( thermonuclease family)